MKLRMLSFVLASLAGCAGAHRLVAPLAYDPPSAPAARAGDVFGAPPETSPAPAPRCVEWKRFTLSNGIPLFVAERHAIPSAAIRIVLATGAITSNDLAEASVKRRELLAATYLRRGDADGVVSAECTMVSCWISARVSAADAGETLARFGSWITDRPGDEKADARRFDAATDSLLRMDDRPSSMLWRNAEVMAFGRPPVDRSVPAAEPTLSDILQERAQIFRPAAATIVVSGDVSPDDMKVQAERAFGKWESKGEGAPAARSVPASPGASFVPRVVYVPSDPWGLAFAAIVGRGPPDSSPDAWAFRVAVQMLGGRLDSELYARVREEMAAAYHPGAEVRWFPQASVALLGGYLENGKVIAATRVMLSSVRALRDHGPELEAFARAKARTMGDVQDAVSNNERVAASLDVVGGEAHPLDPCEARVRIDAVAPDDVRAAMRQYFAEKRLGVLVVAREDQLDAWPADLDMGKVQRRDWLAEDLP
jgi:predicted Zn-dependent peptidase